MPSERGGSVNCFALISRDNRIHRYLMQETITADWISERLEASSLSLPRLTVVVLDNASVHKKAVRARWAIWQERGLFVSFLPPYSPHLNIAEILWRKLKYEWLCPQDYPDKETLHHAVWQTLVAVGGARTPALPARFVSASDRAVAQSHWKGLRGSEALQSFGSCPGRKPPRRLRVCPGACRRADYPQPARWPS